MIRFQCYIGRALEISAYLKSLGLEYGVDFTWGEYLTPTHTGWFFECKDEKYETFIALKFK
jgi:hypothetical protein